MNRIVKRCVLCAAAVAAIAVLTTPSAAHDVRFMRHATHVRAGMAPQSDSADAVATVTAFRDALARGDSAAVLTLLAPDVVIIESGGIESLAEYRSHHLPADITYSRAVPGVHTLRSVVVRGDAAWVSSTSIAKGEFNGRAVNSVSAELVVLSRTAPRARWMIRAVHWSSRRGTP